MFLIRFRKFATARKWHNLEVLFGLWPDRCGKTIKICPEVQTLWTKTNMVVNLIIEDIWSIRKLEFNNSNDTRAVARDENQFFIRSFRHQGDIQPMTLWDNYRINKGIKMNLFNIIITILFIQFILCVVLHVTRSHVFPKSFTEACRMCWLPWVLVNLKKIKKEDRDYTL